MSQYCSYEDCSRFAFINGICYSHDKEEKREAKEKAKVKKAYKIPAKSKKKAKEDVQYTKLRKEKLEEHPNCQIKIMGICEGKAIEVHHPGKRGKNYLNKALFMSACRPCHNHVETVMSAKERRENKFLV
jgi:hypothetical protein